MEASNNQAKPDISGVSEEIQKNIKSDLQASISSTSAQGSSYQVLLSGKKIGISVSDNEELEELGYSAIHLKDLMLEVVRTLLINGATIVYGGNLSKEGYTYLFSDLAFQYRDKQESRKIFFENYFAFPIYTLLTIEEELYFKKHRTNIIKVLPVKEVAEPTKYLAPATLEAKLIWAQSLTLMRDTMISKTDARILVGGKVSNYLGKMPGLIEEAKITLEQNKPLYLIGALGGATKQVIDALAGKGLNYTQNEFHQSGDYQTFKEQYNAISKDLIDVDADAAFFKDFGVQKLASLNGLTPEENERLFISTNLPEMLYYIFKGLRNIYK